MDCFIAYRLALVSELFCDGCPLPLVARSGLCSQTEKDIKSGVQKRKCTLNVHLQSLILTVLFVLGVLYLLGRFSSAQLMESVVSTRGACAVPGQQVGMRAGCLLWKCLQLSPTYMLTIITPCTSELFTVIKDMIGQSQVIKRPC